MRFPPYRYFRFGVGASRASFIAVLGRPLQVTIRRMLRDHSPVCPVTPVYKFITLVYCGQKIGWIKMPLGTEVGLGPLQAALG